MSKLLFNEQSVTPSTPMSTKVAIYVDNTTTPRIKMVDGAGSVATIIDTNSRVKTSSSAQQTGSTNFSADSYLAGSSIFLKTLPKVGTIYHAIFDMTKTAAGTATPIISFRMGTNGTAADTALLTFTFTAGTAAADVGIFELWVTFRSIGSGSTAVVQGLIQCKHQLAATGLTSGGTGGSFTIVSTSAGFNSAVDNSYLGLSFNGGGSFSGTNQFVMSELHNI